MPAYAAAAAAVYSAYQQHKASQAASGASAPGWAGTGTTPYSYMNQGNVVLDPSIRSLQDQYLSGMQSIGTGINQATQDYTSSLGSIGQRYLGNEGSYVQAAVDPVLQQGNQAIGSYTAGAGLRGLGGSSFLGNQLTAMGTDLGRSVADAKAQAVAQNLGFEQNLQGNILGAQQQQAQFGQTTAGTFNTVAMERLNQELQSLGLSQGQAAQAIQALQQQQQTALQSGQLAANTGLGIARLFSGTKTSTNSSDGVG